MSRRTPGLGRITTREWRWVVWFAVAVMALTTVPYVVAWKAAGDQWRFSGFVFGVEDGNSYIAKMLRGAQGAWLFQLSYAPEPHSRAVMFLFHILLGKVTGWVAGASDGMRLHSALVIAYHVARFGSGGALLAVSYRFLAEFLRAVRPRRLGLVLVAFGGGLGWLLGLLPGARLPLDFYSPEAFTFLDLFGLPHLAAARALVLAGVVSYWAALRTGGRWPALRAGLLWLGAALIQPFYVALVYVLAALQFGLRRLQGRATAPAVRAGLIAVAPSLPFILYTVVLFQVDPIYAQWAAQNRIFSPPPLDYAAAWGVLLVPAMFGLRVLRRRNPTAWTWVLVWLVALPFLLYAPYNLQRRTSEGIQLPLVGLALLGTSVGVPAGLRARARLRFRRWGNAVLLVFSLPTALLLWAGSAANAQAPAEPMFIPTAEAELYACLGQSLPARQLVLAAYASSNAVPAFGPLVAYVGHGPEAVYLSTKQREIDAFYDPATPAAARIAQWEALRRPAFVYGPHEAEYGGVDFSDEVYAGLWVSVCESGSYRAFADPAALNGDGA